MFGLEAWGRFGITRAAGKSSGASASAVPRRNRDRLAAGRSARRLDRAISAAAVADAFFVGCALTRTVRRPRKLTDRAFGQSRSRPNCQPSCEGSARVQGLGARLGYDQDEVYEMSCAVMLDITTRHEPKLEAAGRPLPFFPMEGGPAAGRVALGPACAP